MSKFSNWINSHLDNLKPDENKAILVIAVVIGVLAGFGNILYRQLIHLVHSTVFTTGESLLKLDSGWPYLLLLPLIPVVGAILLALMDVIFPGQVHGYGLPRFLEIVNLRGAIFKKRTVLVKALASAITIGTGGSAGTEGPIAQIGGAIGSIVGQTLRMGKDRLRTLVACGVAAGIAGTFNAPLAGVFFAHEIVLLGSFSAANLTPVVISAGVGTLVTRFFEGNRPAFHVPEYALGSHWEIPLYLLLGVIVAFVGVLFIRSFYYLSDRFSGWGASTRVKPLLGAFLAGSVGIFYPEVLGDGYEHIEMVISGELVGAALVMLALAKILATGLTLGSGNAGGVFAPSLFVGAMLGGAYGTIVAALFPSLSITPGTYALAGMGGLLAAATHAPLTAVFLIFEMTGGYSIILPIMFVCIVGYSVSRYFQKDSIDTLELTRRGIHLEQGHEVSVLQSILAKDIMSREVETFPETMPLREVLRLIPGSRHVTFPLVNAQGLMTGILSLQDFREIAFEEGLHDIIVAKELATEKVITVFPDENLQDALDRIGFRNIEHLPVVSREEPAKAIGMLSRRDIISAYNKALLHRPAAKD
jgi:CIC family chloride channel protein